LASLGARPANSEWLRVDFRERRGELELDVSFASSARSVVLFGPSGAGKTSVLRAIAGLDIPSDGNIFLLGEDLARKSPQARRVGFVMQQPSLFPHMTVAQNVAFGARAHSQNILEEFQINHLGHRLPAKLSGGERQRVALVRALAAKPRALLLDEPFSAMDAATKEQTMDQLDAWLRHNSTPVLFVTHDIAEVFSRKAEVILLDRGRVRGQGAAEMVLAEQRLTLLSRLNSSQV
jgi:molybdate transport system ATP-binding protein